MNSQEFISKATELTENIINAISEKDYAKLVDFAQINSSWINPEQTQEEAFLEFGEWLDGQLAIWAEDEEREFVIDPFNEACLENIEFNNNKAFVSYNPTNSGDELDLWFELDFEIKDNKQIIATLNVNI